MPEARIILAQATTWLATCPKSNASYRAINEAIDDVKAHGALPIPLHLRNAATEDMASEGYGVSYANPHDHPHAIVAQQYLPDALSDRRYYDPTGHGVEKTIRERMAWWQRKLNDD
jgi:putative ATPase